MSIYLIALERQLDRRSRLSIQLLKLLEWLACRLPDRLIIDTSAYAAWFQRTHGLPENRFRLVPTGADDRLFQPITIAQKENHPFVVLYYGTFIPNHGVPYIIAAANLLRDQPVQLQLIGQGPDKAAVESFAQEHELENVAFIDWLDKEDLIEYIARADVCLGAFGETPQSVMTVQNKIYECLAMAKPVITGDSPAVRQALTHGEHIYLCRRAAPESLAEAIVTLYGDRELRGRIAENGFAVFQRHYTLEQLGLTYKEILNEIGT